MGVAQALSNIVLPADRRFAAGVQVLASVGGASETTGETAAEGVVDATGADTGRSTRTGGATATGEVTVVGGIAATEVESLAAPEAVVSAEEEARTCGAVDSVGAVVWIVCWACTAGEVWLFARTGRWRLTRDGPRTAV